MMGFGVMGRVLAGLAVVAGLVCGVARAETVLGVTQTSYDYLNRPVCVAVRMNPSVYGSLPTDACVPGTASATYGNDRITRTDYDAAGQAWKITQAYGTGDSRVYQVANHGDDGEVLDIIDARGNRSHSHYDGLNRLREFDYPSPTLATAYDPTSLASALATSGGYNTTACDTGHVADCEAYSYDLDNNRLTTRRRDAAVFTDCYDNLDRVVVHYVHASANCTATGGAADVYTAYDGLGRISDKHFAAFTGAQKVTYAYDGFGRVTSTTDMNGRTVGYQYNAASAVTRLTYADASYVTYTLDSANRIKFASHSSGASLYGQSFNSLGQRGKLTWGGSVGSVGYTWDHAGRLGTMTDDLAGTGNDITWTFAYSPASQVTSWSASSTAYDYKEYATSTVSQAYDGLNRDAAIVSSGGYDARGNMIKDASRVMAYDAENRFLTSAPVATPSSPNTTLAYDPEGRLASYTSVDGSGTHVTEFAYDGTDLIAEYDHTSGTPVLLRSYVHGPGADEPVVWFEGSGFTVKHFLAPNYQSSLIATADASGNLEATYEYDPYGEPEINRANPATVNPWAGPRFRYTGQTLLAGAQLYYYKARVYDPVYGHFLQTDPIGSKDDLDLYAYTGDDPVNKADPTGNQTLTQYVYSAPATVPTADTDWAEAVDMAAYGLAAISDGLLGCQCGPEASLPGEGFKIGSEILEGAAEDMQAARMASNAADGMRREATAVQAIAADNPSALVNTQTYLRDSSGNIAKDPVTGQGRRIDIAVAKNGSADTYEVTSSTATKAAQQQKEDRILQNGGTYVRDGRGKKAPLVPVNGRSKRLNIE